MTCSGKVRCPQDQRRKCRECSNRSLQFTSNPVVKRHLEAKHRQNYKIHMFRSHTLTGSTPPPSGTSYNWILSIDSHHGRLLGVSETTSSLEKFHHMQGRENPIEVWEIEISQKRPGPVNSIMFRSSRLTDIYPIKMSNLQLLTLYHSTI